MVDGQSFRQQGLCITLTLVLFIRGYQGFFIKHSSGLCLQPASKYRVKGKQTGRIDYQWGPLYVVLFQNTCRHSDAQFYFDKTYSVLYNIGKDGTFLARDTRAKTFLYKFHIYHQPQPKTPTLFILLNKFVLKQTSAGALQLNNGYCPTSINYNTNKPNNPLIGSAVYQTKKKFICDKKEEKFMFGEVTKEGENMINVSCCPPQVMKVVMAEYGGFSNGKIFVYENDSDCSLPSACIVKSQCDGKTSCEMNVNSSWFQNDPCQGKTKQLHMEYVCVDSLTKDPMAITTVDDVRLSSDGLPNEGFVEVFKDNSWKIVADENMKRRLMAKALCKFLGYNDHGAEVVFKNTANSGDLFGDLYCHKKSCCANLYPVTQDPKPKLPFVSCAICSEPLMLSNTSKFPNVNIKASPSQSSKDYGARITNSGWCFSNSKGAYLQIDLTLDYVVSQIATFGSKDRKKWMTSYTLKYSRNKMNLDADGEVMVSKANIKGFDVAIQNLSKVYARFLKIIPHGAAGCARIELCGHRLLPGPSENLEIVRKESRSAKISWEAPLIKGEGEIFYIITEKQGLFKNINQTQLGKNLAGLKPFTTYTVKILSTNSHGKTESAYRDITFKTKEAAPDGPPLSVAVALRNTTSFTVSWKPPEKDLSNGLINRYKVCYSTRTNTEICIDDLSVNSYIIKTLKPATKCFVRVAAGTSVGYGDFSESITTITSQKSIVPAKNTFSSLNVSLEKPKIKIASILVIIQTTGTQKKSSESYQPNELNPYSTGSSGPYVTAGFSYDNIPNTFVVGDGASSMLGKITYRNQPLKEDTDYILFVRFIETEEIYYSTVWSRSVKTYQRPEAPGNLKAISLSRNSLHISWEKPNLATNVTLRAFNICYIEHSERQIKCNGHQPASSSFTFAGLKSSTMYQIYISSQTNIGDSLARDISKITNAEPVKISRKNIHGFHIKLPDSKQSVKTVHIIVQAGRNAQLHVPDDYLDLKPYNENNSSNAYITAVLMNLKDSSEAFEVGSGTWYNTSNYNYYNKPLEKNKTYNVFVRLFLKNGIYYSTDWAKSITIPITPPAATKTSKQSSATSLFVGIGISLGLNVVLIVVVIYLTVCRARSQPLTIENVAAKVENRAFSDDVYDEPDHANNEISNTYEELNLKGRETDEHTYQSLVKEATS